MFGFKVRRYMSIAREQGREAYLALTPILEKMRSRTKSAAVFARGASQRSWRTSANSVIDTFRMIAADGRYAVLFVSVFLTIIIALASLCLWYSLRTRLEDLEHIGAYLAGVGQVIIMIWVISTFYMQQRDLKGQRLELTLQRRSTQQQTTIVLYGYFKTQIERTADLILEVLSPTVIVSLERQNSSSIERLLVAFDNTAIQQRVIDMLDVHDTLIESYVNSYVDLYASLKRLIVSVDDGALRQALLLDTPMTDLYYTLMEVRPHHVGFNNGEAV